MTRRIRRPLAAAVLVPLAVVLAACSGPSSGSAPVYKGPALPTSPAKARASLTETASTLLAPLFRSWAAAYHALFPGVTITSRGAGPGAISTDAVSGAVSLTASDACLSAADQAKNPGTLNIALAISAQQVTYNVPGVRAPLRLDAGVLAAMYSGKITRWNDPAVTALNPGAALPRLPVVPVHRADGSGDTLAFTSYLNGQDPAGWPPARVGTAIGWPAVTGAPAAQGDSGVLAACSRTRGCVGYLSISDQQKAQAARLGQAELRNAAGRYVPPDPSTITTAAYALAAQTPASESVSLVNSPAVTAYPMTGYIYALVGKKQTSAAVSRDLRAFLHWAVTAGNLATYLAPLNLQALPGQVVALSNAQIEKIG